MRPRLPTTLTGRLLLTAVALVAVAGLLVSLTTSLVLRQFLTAQLDDDIRQGLGRAAQQYDDPRRPPRQSGSARDDDGDGDRSFQAGDANGILTARLDSTPSGEVLLRTRDLLPAAPVTLTASQLSVLTGVEDEDAAFVDLPGLGSYRVLMTRTSDGSAVLVAGQPAGKVESATRNMLWIQLLLTAAGVGIAAIAGDRLIRRTLKPLREVASTAHEVAALPLDSGEVGETARVPTRLTDPRTEVGQVGAALNQLLGHMESALDARHRSELQVRQFVADASHELRTPLATIMGYAELARRSSSYDPAAALLKVEEEGVRMRGLVEDLLLLARLDSGRPLADDEVDLTKLALETVEDARVVGRGHQWVLELPEEPVLVTGDGDRLHQVLSNLLTNARRHTPAGTRVVVGLRAEGRSAVLTVADDGPGIPADLLPGVFERFTRADASRTRDSGGAGLGLALVEAIVSAHGGHVGVTSHPGETVFTVSLPAA